MRTASALPAVFDALDDDARRKLRKTKRPQWVAPMLATLTKDYFSDPAWLYERKLDGVRILAYRNGASARLWSRNRLEWTHDHPALVAALAAQPADDFIVDGELVAFEGEATSFARLQGRGRGRAAAARAGADDARYASAAGIACDARSTASDSARVYLYVFDVLRLAGRDTTGLRLDARKALLRRALRWRGPLRYTEHREREGVAMLEEACAQGWEGVIAKRADAPYVSGRSRDWLKFKCTNRQELVIGGWTDPRGARVGLGALLVGYYERGVLRYAGKVGTGFNDALLAELTSRLQRLERSESPFAETPRHKGVHWAAPQLVGEFAFLEWTRDGKLRHPTFLGLRADKSPREVRRERPRPRA